ncbi:hypothetical protein ACFHW2_14105 [Actinomadura sp. LOL_016]|uniref:hypothetical protein n=1 Tax=unclassified Actinomadura TaxID=2626254 RepID=UPI003A800F2A
MQDPPDSTEISAGSPVTDGAGSPEADSAVLAEVLPGVVVAFGDVLEELKLELELEPIDFGLVSATDREQISTFLASVGNAATVGGNLANAFASLEGLYRTTDLTQAILNAGGTLAIKDGANIGAVFFNGKIIHQARIMPVTKLSAAQKMASIGPALAMVALQMQLSEAAGLVRTNIALTGQVLTTLNHAQWGALTGLVKAVDDALREAQEVGSVTQHVWEPVATKKAELLTARDQYGETSAVTSKSSSNWTRMAAASTWRRTPRPSSSTPTPSGPPSKPGPSTRCSAPRRCAPPDTRTRRGSSRSSSAKPALTTIPPWPR